jgi:SAM-dependent methyltransferase
MSAVYDAKFYEDQSNDSLVAAEIVLGLLFEHGRPASVVDVGCGVGTWARTALQLAVPEVFGIDGDYVDRNALLVPEVNFLPCDLAVPGVAELALARLGRRYDLAISMEVAEHLPHHRAPGFVAELCSLSDVVLFSAAIPFQGGTAHVNEQWPEFWATYFRDEGFACCDLLRPLLWTMPAVKWWYAQNTLLFVRSDSPAFGRFPEAAMVHDGGLARVHPAAWLSSIMNRWHPYRSAAREEESRDLEAVVAAWVAGAPAPPALAAVARAEAAPADALDVFPHTRMTNMVPEQLLAEAAAEGAALRTDLAARDAHAALLAEEAVTRQASFDAALARLQAERASLEAEAQAAEERQAAALRESLAEARSRIAEAERQAGEAASEAQALRARLAELEPRLASGDAARLQVEALHASTSWRATAPLRALGRLLGR